MNNSKLFQVLVISSLYLSTIGCDSGRPVIVGTDPSGSGTSDSGSNLGSNNGGGGIPITDPNLNFSRLRSSVYTGEKFGSEIELTSTSTLQGTVTLGAFRDPAC